MTLSQPVRRKLSHTRQYKCCGYEREDDLYDIEVEMTDVKPHSFDNYDRGYISANEPLHHMQMRVTIDESMLIHDVEATTIAAPYSVCPNITDNYKQLIGLRIVPGFTEACRNATSGVNGCTHHNDILRILGTVAYQTMWPILKRRGDEAKFKSNKESGQTGKTAPTKPPVLNTCHAYAQSSAIVKRQWPEHFKPE